MPAAGRSGFAESTRAGTVDPASPVRRAVVGHPRGDVEWYAAWGSPGSAYRFSARSVSGSGMVVDGSYAGTGALASRDSATTHRATSDWLMLSVPLAGCLDVSWHGRDDRLRAGQFGIVSTVDPVEFQVSRRVRSITVFLPPEQVECRASRVTAALGRPLPSNPAFDLLVQHLRHTLQLGRTLDQQAREAATRAAAELLAAALGSAEPEAAPSHGAVRRAQITDYIDRSLADPSLSVARIAAAHHLSPRSLHRLFDAAGETVASYIRRRRLERCHADVLSDPRVPISEIGPRWGLVDSSHLARQFRAQFGVSPQDLRRSGWGSDPDETAQLPRSAMIGPEADGLMSKSKIAVGR